MGILAQHGYGKGDKIERGLDRGVIEGVILNPRFHAPDGLTGYVGALREAYGDKVILVVDPHFFLTAFPDAPIGQLDKHSYFLPGLTRAQLSNPRTVRAQVKACLDFQRTMPLSRLMGPTVYFEDFSDRWNQIALNFAAEALEQHSAYDQAPPLILSFVFGEGALNSKDGIDEFLDVVSTWEPGGFALTVKQSDQAYPALFHEDSLANLLYLVYALGHLNEFECICEYTDLVGFLLHSVGASHTATGWFNSLRRFPQSALRASKGGRPRNPRYSSGPLLNSVTVLPELDAIYGFGRIADVLSGTAEDHVFASSAPASVNWTLGNATLHHWEVCQSITNKATDDLSTAELMIDEAIQLYGDLRSVGVPFQAGSGPRNAELWSRAAQTFRSMTGT